MAGGETETGGVVAGAKIPERRGAGEGVGAGRGRRRCPGGATAAVPALTRAAGRRAVSPPPPPLAHSHALVPPAQPLGARVGGGLRALRGGVHLAPGRCPLFAEETTGVIARGRRGRGGAAARDPDPDPSLGLVLVLPARVLCARGRAGVRLARLREGGAGLPLALPRAHARAAGQGALRRTGAAGGEGGEMYRIV